MVQPTYSRALASETMIDECLKRYHPNFPISKDQEEIKILKEIFKILSTKSLPFILWNKPKIEQMESKVTHIHPLNFVEIVTLEPELKTYFKKLFESKGHIWSVCCQKFTHDLIAQHKLSNITPHLDAFTSKLPLNPSLIKQQIHESLEDGFDSKQLIEDCLNNILE